MRILFLLNTLGSGGTESSLSTNLPFFVEFGIEPLVAIFEQTKSEDGAFEEKIAQHSKITRLPSVSRYEKIVNTRKLIKDWKPDLVHSSLIEANLVARIASLSLDHVLVNSLVSTSYTKARFAVPHTNVFKHRCLQLIDMLTGLLFVDHFHAVNETVKREAERALLLPGQRVTVVQRGRPICDFNFPDNAREKIRRRLGIPEDAFLLCNVGRQSYIKGQIDLLKAFVSAVGKSPKMRLIIAGREGDCSQLLEDFISSHELHSSISLLGHRDDIPELLFASDLFVFPSHLEGIGGAAIEAMAAGLPVIASDIPGLRETIGNQAESNFVPPQSPSELSRAILALESAPEIRKQQGAENRKRFEEKFQVRPNAEAMIAFYRECLKKGKSRLL